VTIKKIMVWLQKNIFQICDDNFFYKMSDIFLKNVQDNFEQRKSCKKMQNGNTLNCVMVTNVFSFVPSFKILTDARNDNAEQRCMV